MFRYFESVFPVLQFSFQGEELLPRVPSTMDLSILANNHVSLTTLDNKYSPTALVLPFEGNSRQSQLIHQQVQFSKEEYNKLWFQIIKQKISNQSRVLSLLGCPGAEKIGTYAQQMKKEDIDSSESLAAKDYFQFYHEGLNRRNDDPVNGRLNYGYAIVRSAIARAIVLAVFRHSVYIITISSMPLILSMILSNHLGHW
jgi:CRISPR-associated protein Cas1